MDQSAYNKMGQSMQAEGDENLKSRKKREAVSDYLPFECAFARKRRSNRQWIRRSATSSTRGRTMRTDWSTTP